MKKARIYWPGAAVGVKLRRVKVHNSKRIVRLELPQWLP